MSDLEISVLTKREIILFLEKITPLTMPPVVTAMTNLTSASELYLLVVTHIKCVAVNWGLATGK